MKTNNANESKIGWLHKVTNELNALTKRKDVLAEETASSEKMKQGIIDEISALSIKKNKMLSEVDKYNMTLVELHKNKKALLKELQDNKDQREKEIESFNSTTNQKEKELDKLKGHLNSQIDLLYDREKLVKEREETLKLSEGETEQKKEELEEGVKQLNEARKESSDKAIQAQKNYEYADVKVKESQAIVSKVHEKLDALKVMEDRRDAILLEREEAVKETEKLRENSEVQRKELEADWERYSNAYESLDYKRKKLFELKKIVFQLMAEKYINDKLGPEAKELVNIVDDQWR